MRKTRLARVFSTVMAVALALGAAVLPKTAHAQHERRTISAISGNQITLDKKLDYMHFGKITFDVDERGGVGLD
jgi:hypothetical protein